MEIIIKNLVKEFEHNKVLDNINLNLKQGKIYGFIGRNGSGKSVLFKIMCGFYQPTIGEVLCDGKNIHKENSFLPDTRVLIEKPEFLPDISGIDNLEMLAKIQNKINIDEINETLDLVNLSKEDRLKKYHKYSLGMKQKLGIAQVIMENPQIMIFDEPFNGIEEETVDKIKEFLKSINHKDKIIVMASHNKEDIESLCDEIYRIDGGKCINIK